MTCQSQARRTSLPKDTRDSDDISIWSREEEEDRNWFCLPAFVSAVLVAITGLSS